MVRRTLEHLNLKDEDYVFVGDIEIKGNVNIENADLIVSGSIIFSEDESQHSIHIMNGNISANKISGNITITIELGDIYCHNKLLACNINISGGDIFVGELDSCDITSDGDIIVLSNSRTGNVFCCNYLVAGHNDSCNITACEDIYILGDNLSLNLSARDIFLGSEHICLISSYIVASRALEANIPIQHCDPNCKFIRVGR